VSADLAIPGLEATVMCRNMMSGPTVIASDPKQTHEVIFQGKDDPNGEDVQPIPEEMKRSPAFARAIRQGILQVVAGEDDPIIKGALARQTDAFAKRMAADELKARESLDHKADSDLIVVTCIGPGPREGTTCEEQLPVRSADQGSRPPLCARHEHLSGLCVKRGSGPWQLEA
jgi:hypothetical protein